MSGTRVGSNEAGFSLIEVILALSILGYGVLAIAAGQIASLGFNDSSRQNTLAMSLAEQQMEIFRLMPVADVKDLTTDGNYPNDPNNPIDPDPNDEGSMSFNRRWLIEADTPEAGVVSITVEVDWRSSSGETRTVRLQSLKADPS